MNEYTQDRRDYRFAIGLLTGTVVGAGLAIWLSPKVALAKTRVGAAVDELTRKGQDVRDDVADAVAHGAHEVERGAREVARGAHEVERFATAAKSDRIAGARKHSAV